MKHKVKSIKAPANFIRSICKITGLIITLFLLQNGVAKANNRQFKIEKKYLNIPLGNRARMKLFKINVNGVNKREFPVQLAEDTVNYWIFIDVTEFKGKTITLSCPATTKALSRIYQADKINGEDSLYKESFRPLVHFTAKRGWNNDVNGPIYFKGQYHLFWQAFPFGNSWNTGYMYWGHATSTDMLHWTEHQPALMVDSLGAAWSGTAVIDKNNVAGWGKNTMILYYTAFDLTSFKQVQCIAYSTDGGHTFKKYKLNPVIDSNWEVGSNDTRDPKVFYYEPAKVWVMVLFERDGLSFYNSTDMKKWKKQSHFKGLYECPDFFELPVDDDANNKKWVLHGGSVDYYIGSFDGKTFTPETPRQRYATGHSDRDILYAAQSFANMPDNRRVQMGWGRITHPNMPFSQMILFPTEFTLRTTPTGIKLMANPIREIETLHAASYKWTSLKANEANDKLSKFHSGAYHIKAKFTIAQNDSLRLNYKGNEILSIAAKDCKPGENTIEIILDKTSSEIFINGGEHYVIERLTKFDRQGLMFTSPQNSIKISELELYELKSVWDTVDNK